MERDMDLVRAILLEVERRAWAEQGKPVEIEGYSGERVSYHVRILDEAGLMAALDASSFKGLAWYPISLTWEGHDFLDAAREDTRWNRAKQLVKDKAGSVSFDVFKQLLINLSLKTLGL